MQTFFFSVLPGHHDVRSFVLLHPPVMILCLTTDWIVMEITHEISETLSSNTTFISLRCLVQMFCTVKKLDQYSHPNPDSLSLDYSLSLARYPYQMK